MKCKPKDMCSYLTGYVLTLNFVEQMESALTVYLYQVLSLTTP